MKKVKREAAAQRFKLKTLRDIVTLEHFQFEMLRISNHTACRFAEKTRFFRSLWAGRRRAAASRFTFFKVETLYPQVSKKKSPLTGGGERIIYQSGGIFQRKPLRRNDGKGFRREPSAVCGEEAA